MIAATLDVTRGPNQGARARLFTHQAVVVGGGPTAADIVLDEPCAAERHLRVEVVCGGWAVRVLPLEPGFRFVRHRPWPRTRHLAPGRPVRLFPLVSGIAGAQFACGGTVMRVTPPGIRALVRSGPGRGAMLVRALWARRPRVLAAASAGAVAALTAASAYSWSHAGRIEDGGRPPSPGATRDVSPRPPCASTGACAEAVAQALRDRLGAAGPAHRVEALPPDDAGAVVVRVALPDDGHAGAHEVRRWFDGLPQSQVGVRLEIDRAARPADGPPALAIAAFSPGPGGQVMLQGGQTYQEGGGLGGGWRLEAVARDRVVLAHRDGRRHEITGLAPPEETPAQPRPDPAPAGEAAAGAFLAAAPPPPQQRGDTPPREGRQNRGDGRRPRGGEAIGWKIER